jgi:hypothetical protein
MILPEGEPIPFVGWVEIDIKKMNNKPVAWMNSKGDIILPAHQANKDYNIPLYTAPRELSDEEILKIAKENTFEFNEIPPVQFARAILKKASDK